MGYDYALVHLRYTIPPAIPLTFVYRRLCTTLDVYKIFFLITIAVASTIPWDSYLIHHNVWSYPPNAIIGPTFLRIPAEELFFFVIQTYNTSLLYLILSKPVFHPAYIKGKQQIGRGLRVGSWVGQAVIATSIGWGIAFVLWQGKSVYLGLILIWAGPFVLLLWTLAYQLIICLPLSNTLLPIALPTLYLWVVDTLALKRGTWVIESGTKLGWHLWDGLEIEEAFFFLATNVLIVFGLIAFDNALAVLDTFPSIFPIAPALPSPVLLVKALLVPVHDYEEDRISGLTQALARLRKKSRSFYLASGVFQRRLRIDLILLYSFCRVADDLVDEASSAKEARYWINAIVRYLDIAFSARSTTDSSNRLNFVIDTFPPSTHAALLLLPTSYLSSQPLYELMKGFETDLQFKSLSNPYPIHDLQTLQVYAAYVAGTVAKSCLELAYYHTTNITLERTRKEIINYGDTMGVALQYINIARDITVDSHNGRVYLPTNYLKEADLTPGDVLKDPCNPKIERLRQRLLDDAFQMYRRARGAIKRLPSEAQGPMRVAVESYMEIGRVLRTPGYQIKAGRATVPKTRRLLVAWRALGR